MACFHMSHMYKFPQRTLPSDVFSVNV
uniref:Uncharacterized protein n=1 Tax=Anguilla anguilla TaxID=7936 RepID=A0A0E9UPH9_ANGAN